MTDYPLYDVPYLVREPNGPYMSFRRHKTEKQNQAMVDDYFLARDKGVPADEARKQVAKKHETTPKKVLHSLIWYCQEAKKRKKYDFLEKFALELEHII